MSLQLSPNHYGCCVNRISAFSNSRIDLLIKISTTLLLLLQIAKAQAYLRVFFVEGFDFESI